MPFSPRQFEQDSGFERYILDEIAPALSIIPGLLIVDYREEDRATPRVHASVGGMPARAQAYINGEAAKVDVTPMIFGVAWKTLDLVVDGVLGPKQNGAPLSIEAKCKTALTGNGPRRPNPFSNEMGIWKRCMHLYGNTMDLRHSIVHREVIQHQDGSIEATPNPNRNHPPTVMTREQLGCFFRVVQGFASALVNESLPTAEKENLLFLLDQLQAQHGQDPLPGREITRAVVVLAKAQLLPSGDVEFDARPSFERTRSEWPTAAVDLVLRLPDGTILTGPLEDAPLDGPKVLDGRYPPAWLREVPATVWAAWER